jgi:hypothetical protein
MMQDHFANLFVAIQERLQTAAPEVKWIDQDFGQLESYQDGYKPAVLFPCVLLDFTGFQWQEVSKGTQHGEGFVIVRVAFTPYTNTNQLTPTAQKEKALQCYEIERIVYQALQGWSDGNFARLLRRSTDTEKREDTIRVRVMQFATSITDEAAKPVYQTVATPGPVIGGDIEV